MSNAQPAWHVFASSDELAEALAGRIAQAVGEALRLRGRATLAVSGGRTPVKLLQALSQRSLDWGKVTVTLVDERCVPPQDARSNARLVRENLLAGEATRARFVPLYQPAATPEAATLAAARAIGELPMPFDVVVLGMGLDGHTASFFPDATGLADLMENRDQHLVLPVMAPSAGEPRLTLPLQTLCTARLLVLHIEGEDKRRVLTAALDANGPRHLDRPVSAVFAHARDDVQVYWAP